MNNQIEPVIPGMVSSVACCNKETISDALCLHNAIVGSHVLHDAAHREVAL